MPYICTSDGTYRIDQKTIDNIVSGGEYCSIAKHRAPFNTNHPSISDIEFPFRYSGPIDVQKIVNMASNYSGPKTVPSMDIDLLEDKISAKSVQPPPNINIDDLWHPAHRS